jgi:hypothetical protein
VVSAERWLQAARPRHVLGAAAVLLGTAREDRVTRNYCVDLIRRGRHRSGGWGPYVASAPEPFDTAVVLLALAKLQTDRAESWNEWGESAAKAGRRYLLATQRADGSWPGTTRPAGAVSYAHRLSTTGWVTLALLETQPDVGRQGAAPSPGTD